MKVKNNFQILLIPNYHAFQIIVIYITTTNLMLICNIYQ